MGKLFMGKDAADHIAAGKSLDELETVDWWQPDDDVIDSDPIPLTDPVSVPPFPVDALPEVIGNMVGLEPIR